MVTHYVFIYQPNYGFNIRELCSLRSKALTQKIKKGGSRTQRRRKDDKQNTLLVCFVVKDVRIDKLT